MSKETSDINSILRDLKNSGTDVDKLKEEIDKRGLTKDAAKFEKQYKNQINSFIEQMNAKGDMTSEEKAALVVEMKNKLSPSQQKQFSAVMNALKKYLKK